MYPYIFREKCKNSFYDRYRFITSDKDFIDLDCVFNNQDKIVVLCHGLEGSSSSQYMMYSAMKGVELNFDVLALNMRSCSGEMNKNLCMYHSGFTRDLHDVVESISSKYNHISLVGFSMGGNVVLKYISDGMYNITPKIKAVVTQSVPCDLSGSAKEIAKWYNYLYEKRFMNTLCPKMMQKHKLFPDSVSIDKIGKVKSLYTFDEYFTAPLHDFDDAEDYYTKCNCLQFLENISIPTLIINALDDPFLSPKSYPHEIADSSDYVHLSMPKYGGHLGFTTFKNTYYWNENETFNFIQNVS